MGKRRRKSGGAGAPGGSDHRRRRFPAYRPEYFLKMFLEREPHPCGQHCAAAAPPNSFQIADHFGMVTAAMLVTLLQTPIYSGLRNPRQF